MEDGLVHINLISIESFPKRLNPCCNGRWSRTIHPFNVKTASIAS